MSEHHLRLPSPGFSVPLPPQERPRLRPIFQSGAILLHPAAAPASFPGLPKPCLLLVWSLDRLHLPPRHIHILQLLLGKAATPALLLERRPSFSNQRCLRQVVQDSLTSPSPIFPCYSLPQLANHCLPLPLTLLNCGGGRIQRIRPSKQQPSWCTWGLPRPPLESPSKKASEVADRLAKYRRLEEDYYGHNGQITSKMRM